MSILDGIKDKAKSLINMSEPYVIRKTTSYDASKNKVIVAGYVLDSVVTSVVNADVITRQEQGIDYYYTTYFHSIEQRTLSVTVLPTAKCLDVMRVLALRQQETKGWFNIAVHENDKIVNVYRGWITSLPELSMAQDAGDRTILFAIKSMTTSATVIDQPTEFEKENYSKYGNRPDYAGDAKSVNEFDSQVTTHPVEGSVGERLEDIDYVDLPIDPPEVDEGVQFPDDGT